MGYFWLCLVGVGNYPCGDSSEGKEKQENVHDYLATGERGTIGNILVQQTRIS